VSVFHCFHRTHEIINLKKGRFILTHGFKAFYAWSLGFVAFGLMASHRRKLVAKQKSAYLMEFGQQRKVGEKPGYQYSLPGHPHMT
jgi:hypothetical protein